MRIDVLTLFPQMFEQVLGSSILKRAAEDTPQRTAPVSYHLTDIRDHTLDPHGNPAVAWEHHTVTDSGWPKQQSFVKRWDPGSGTWADLGAIAIGMDNSASAPSLAVDDSSALVVAWIESESGWFPGGGQVYVKRWDSSTSAWQLVGSSPNQGATRRAHNPTVAVDSVGHPIVAWSELPSIVVKRWDGTNWVRLGYEPLSIHGILADYSSLVVDDLDRPVVAWSERIQVLLSRRDRGRRFKSGTRYSIFR